MTPARKYFRNALSSYFTWADHGRELCWCNGVTIAFHEEISPVLDRLVDQNFPDFSTLALSLATLRNSWPEVAAQLTDAFTFLASSPIAQIRKAADSRNELFEAWPESLRKLSLLSSFVEVYSPSTLQRCELLALVFGEFSSNFAASTQEELATAFRSGLPEDWLVENERHSGAELLLLPRNLGYALRIGRHEEITTFAVPRILRMLRIANSLAACIPCDTVEQLDQLLKTGIADDIKAPEDELLDELQDQRAQARGLLEQLSDDAQLSGFARLTKQLIAAITLPRTLSEPDDLQMGGISDIANRGRLDSLLLSELAHDDLTLAVRLAMNEALYMRRESPPSPQTRTRSVLIDLSLPMWGIPRLYATAAAMALHVTSDKQIRIHCFRSSLTGMKATKLTTREGLQEHMSALEPTEHPGASLQSFFQAILDEPLSAEPVLITTSDVLESTEFRQTLDKTCIGDLWLIVVERDGRLKVLQRTRQGTSVRKQLQLPLDEILSPRTAAKIRRTDLPDDLPAIFHLAKFPLLLSHEIRISRLWKWGESAIAVTDDGRLMHWTEKGLGARQLATGLSGRGDVKIFISRRLAGTTLQLLFCPMGEQAGTLVTVSGMNDDVTIQRADYRVPIVSDIVVTEPALLVFGKTHEGLEVCSAITHYACDFLGTHILGHDFKARTGRCMLHAEKGFCVLNWVGGHASWLLQKLPEPYQRYVGVEEARSAVAEITSGVYFAISMRQLIDPQFQKRFDTLNDVLQNRYDVYLHSFLEVSVDGDLAVLGHVARASLARTRSVRDSSPTSPLIATTGRTTVDLRSGKVISSTNKESTGNEIARIEYERAFHFVRQHTPHYRFSRIGTDSGRLVLQDPSGGLFHVAWDSTNRAIRLGPAGETAALPQLIEFIDTPACVSEKNSTSNEAERPVDDADKYTVRLTGVGENQISIIKTIRTATNVSLREAINLAEGVPIVLSQGVSKKSADALQSEIINAGGTCEILPSQCIDQKATATGVTLQKAEWENGSKAWLDSRGLLHLKSANRTHPEITLVMRDGPLSGWLSSGEVFGDNYYCGKDPTAQGLRRVTADFAWNSAIRLFIESVPWNFHYSSDTAQTGNTVLPGY